VPIQDPGDKPRTPATWYEVSNERDVADHTELYAELRFVLALTRVASRP
jgi:hypothetical protein